ncbi:MAG TPA: hypothetical protein VGD99_17385 [Anaerolineae bacterium]|jgi:hypothetical protein
MPDPGHLPSWLQANAWREIFARIFEGLDGKINVSPEWLVNPATNRRLKLDMLYPSIGVAVRFEGLQAKGQRKRPSLEEEVQQRSRDNARVALCEAHEIALIVIDSTDPEPKPIFQEIDRQLSRAGQRLKDKSLREKTQASRATATTISRRVKSMADLKLYADLWQDRQYQIPEPTASTSVKAIPDIFAEGMEVEHTAFGPGVVLAIAPSENDTLVTVDFITAGQKTLAASLVGDKLWPRQS